MSRSIAPIANRPRPSRRSVLRGAGALLALPFLDTLAMPLGTFGAAAEAAAKPPLRMGIFTVTGGTVLESWKNTADGPLSKLPSILRPLEFAKDQMLLLNGLAHNGNGESVNGHQHCALLHLTGAPQVSIIGGKPKAGQSVDQAAAQAAGQHTYLPSMELGLSGGEQLFSFRDSESLVPYESSPRRVFERMFRGRQPIVPNWSRRAALAQQAVRQSSGGSSYDRSVLDLVMADAKDVDRDLARSDRHKLDEYLTSVRSIEKRIETMEAVIRMEMLDAANPGPGPLAMPSAAERASEMWLGEDYKIRDAICRDPEKHAEYIRIMAELMVLAMQTDTSRVCTLAVGSDEAQFPGVVTVGYERHCHTLEHQGNAGRVEDADPISREACRQMHAWYTTLFAEMVKKMQTIDEGGTTLLDNTMLLYTSYMADGGHGKTNYPALLVGKAGGTLKPGRQVNYKEGTPMANLYLEMLDRMGAKSTEFGDSKVSEHAMFGGRLPDLV